MVGRWLLGNAWWLFVGLLFVPYWLAVGSFHVVFGSQLSVGGGLLEANDSWPVGSRW